MVFLFPVQAFHVQAFHVELDYGVELVFLVQLTLLLSQEVAHNFLFNVQRHEKNIKIRKNGGKTFEK